MISLKQIKFVKSLQQQKFRKEHRLFVAEGSTLVMDLLGGRFKAEAIYAMEDWVKQSGQYPLVSAEKLFIVSPKEMQRMSGMKTPAPLMAVFSIPDTSIEIPGNSLVLVLDGIRDPGNLGTIIRTADWFGIKHLLCSEDSVEMYNPKVVQASMGSLGRVNVVYKNPAACFSGYNSRNIFGTFLDGASIHEVAPPEQGFIVIGSESHGIRDEVKPYIKNRITIAASPGSGVESLNAAVAAGIICYWVKQ